MKRRLESLEQQVSDRVSVWSEDPDNPDVFHSRDGRTVTRAELANIPGTRILVTREETPMHGETGENEHDDHS